MQFDLNFAASRINLLTRILEGIANSEIRVFLLAPTLREILHAETVGGDTFGFGGEDCWEWFQRGESCGSCGS